MPESPVANRNAKATRFPAQRKLLAEYARVRGFNITYEFIDIESAKNPGRKQFGNMLKLLETDTACRIVLVGENRPSVSQSHRRPRV